MSFKNRVKDSLIWWLSKKPFILDDIYEIKLLYIDRENHSAKIQITNIKTKEQKIEEVNNE